MPKKTNSKRNQAQDSQPADQSAYGAYSASYDVAPQNYSQSTYDGLDSYGGYDSGTYDAAAFGYDVQPAYDGAYPQDYPRKKRGAGFYVGIAIAAIALVAAIVVGTFLFMNSTQIYPTHRSGELGQLDGKSKEEIQAELDRIVEEGMFNIAIANVVQLQNGSSEGDFSIENSPANRYNMQVEIAVADTGEVVYTSGVLEPNYHIQTAKLDTPLSKGTYNCIATFHALDPEKDDAEVGQAAASMTIVVLN